ncbi:MAG: signal peptidase II [Actinomycetota bacterium]
MSLPGNWRLPLAIAVAVVVVDQLTKEWALNELSDGRTIHVVWTLQFNLAFNSGMAFGRGQGLGPVIGVVATLVIVWLLLTLRNESSRLSAIGMGLLIGGAAGNLIDRLFRGDAWFRGAVVDFIDFQWFPIFNIADMAINIGAGLLILGSVLQARRRNGDDDEPQTVAATDVDTPDR